MSTNNDCNNRDDQFWKDSVEALRNDDPTIIRKRLGVWEVFGSEDNQPTLVLKAA